MIDADIVYARAETAEDAVLAWTRYARGEAGGSEGLRYFGGGTEIATNARKAALPPPRALIDIKRIADARRLERADGRLYLGAALSLNEVADSELYPLLTATVRRVADRTTRNRLSLGGNLAGNLPYREAALPLLLADAKILTILPGPLPGSPPERRERALRSVFDKRLLLEPGELVLGFTLSAGLADLPWKHYRATRSSPVDYPLATACFLDLRTRGAGIAAAVSGIHPYPVLFESTETLRAAIATPGVAKTDQRASAEYRRALILDMLRRAEEELA